MASSISYGPIDPYTHHSGGMASHSSLTAALGTTKTSDYFQSPYNTYATATQQLSEY